LIKVDSRLVIGGSSVLSLAVGSVVGFFVAKKKLSSDFEARLSREIAETKEYYSILHKRDGYATPQNAVDALRAFDDSPEHLLVFEEAAQSFREYGGKPLEFAMQSQLSQLVVPEQVNHNVFEKAEVDVPREDRDLDYEAEVEARIPGQPYVISADEFNENATGYSQPSLTYYKGDNVLADGDDSPVDIEACIGSINLQRFGAWSGDPRVVYVRNENLRIDCEVLLHDGTYLKEVLGMDPPSRNRPTLDQIHNGVSPRERFEGKTMIARGQVNNEG
jgi:hypothetical protein